MPPVADLETPSIQDIRNNGYAGTNGGNKVMEGGTRLDGRCRASFEQIEIVEHPVAGYKVLANGEYLSRHNRALMILAIA